jgi:anti-sigma-K factor RskA
MENNENIYIERIHRYLAGALSDSEKATFEQEMATDATFAQAVGLEKKLLSGIHLVGEDDLKKSIASARQRLAEQQFFEAGKIVSIHAASTTKSFSMRKAMSIAAAAIVLLGLAWWGFFREARPDADQLFAANFKPETTNP